jgi:CMP-N-acetylneuraminic acid synthetase
MRKDSVIVFVHAKGNSTRVKNKNLKKLKNKPLIYYAIKKALRCKLVDQVIIDSDSDKILKIGKSLGAVPIKRPKNLANNKTGGDDLALYQASLFPKSKVCVQFVPTSPLIKIKTLEECIKAVLGKYDSAITVFSDSFYQWRNGKPIYYIKGRLPNGVELPKILFETTGLYVNKTKSILKLKRRFNSKNCYLKKVTRIETVDLNTYDDFSFAESINSNDYNN